MLWHCLTCTTRYAFSLLACPHCRSGERRPADQVDEEDRVGKTAKWAGPSVPGEPLAPDAPDEAVPVPELEPVVLKTDLQDQARELGLPVSGTKAQLADAVAEAVAGAAEPEPEPEPEPKAAPSLSKAKDG